MTGDAEHSYFMSRVPVRDGGTARRSAYVLLEVVVAAGLLVVGLAVIGAQVHDSQTSIRKSERQFRAMLLAEQYFAMMDLGLVELDSIDEVVEGDFGPRYPDWGWIMATEQTSVDAMFRLRLDVLHHVRDDEYRKDTFDVDESELIYTSYAFRPAPAKLNLAADFGLTEEEFDDVSRKLADSGIPNLDPQSFDPSFLGRAEFEDLVKALPVILDALHMELGDLEAMLPPEVLEELRESGVLEREGGDGGGAEDGGPGGGQ